MNNTYIEKPSYEPVKIIREIPENYHIPGTPNRNQRMEIERRDRRKRK